MSFYCHYYALLLYSLIHAHQLGQEDWPTVGVTIIVIVMISDCEPTTHVRQRASSQLLCKCVMAMAVQLYALL